MKKSKILLLSSSLLLFLLVTVSMSYAFFQVSTTSDYTNSHIGVSSDSVGSVALDNSNNTITLELSKTKFNQPDNDFLYYSESTIATASAIGKGDFICTYEMSVSKTATNDLYNAFQGMSTKSEGQIYLKVNDDIYDFNTPNLFDNFTITGKIYSVSASTPRKISAGIYVVNKKDVFQDDISGKDINITLTVTNFSCDPRKPSGGKTILANNTLKRNITSYKTYNEPCPTCEGQSLNNNNATLYRYVGNYEDVDNNYICFGVSNRHDCLIVKSTHLYRILGIKEDGTMKLILERSTLDGNVYDNIGDSIDNTWSKSSLFKFLNNDFLDKNYTVEWKNKILNYDWAESYATATVKNTYNAESLYEVERLGNLVTAKVGLMYMYDYYYANGWDGEQSYDLDGSAVMYSTDGWIYRSHSTYAYTTYEWLLTQYRGTKAPFQSFAITNYDNPKAGDVTAAVRTSNLGVRPVIYITNLIQLTGSGTLSDPYIIHDL